MSYVIPPPPVVNSTVWWIYWLVTFSTVYTMVKAHQFMERRVAYSKISFPIPDLLHEISLLFNTREWWESQTPLADAGVTLFALITFLIIPGESARTGNIYALVMILRFFATSVTILPSSSRVEGVIWWQGYIPSHPSMKHDLIISGHTAIVILSWWTWFIVGYSWLVLAPLLFIAGLLSASIVLVREHYTVDMFLALVISSLMVNLYYTNEVLQLENFFLLKS